MDALVVAAQGHDRVFVLRGEDHAYRVLFEALSEGAMTIAPDATILYANQEARGDAGPPAWRRCSALP